MDLKASVLETLQEKNVEIFDVEQGILRCKYCGEDWVMEKNFVSVTEEEGHVKLAIMVNWNSRLPHDWWKCPEGCWRVV